MILLMKKGRKNLITCDASMNIWVIIRKKINIKHFSKICTIIKEKKIQECFIKKVYVVPRYIR